MLSYSGIWLGVGWGQSNKMPIRGESFFSGIKQSFLFKNPCQENIQLIQSSNYPSGVVTLSKGLCVFLLHKTVSGNGAKPLCAQGVGGVGVQIHLWLRSRWRGGVEYIPQQLNIARSVSFCHYYICFKNVQLV